MLHVFLPAIFIFGLTLFVYIKIRYPFWNNQPVFHTYDYWRYFYTEPFIVYKHNPLKTKFCDFLHVETIPYLESSANHQSNMADLLQCYYIGSERILHTLSKEDLHAYFIGHNEPAYLSFYNETHYHEKIDPSYQILPLRKPIGAVSSRPSMFYYRPTQKDIVYRKMPAYVIDFLCVQRDRDVKKINRSLLQTHEYNQRKKNPNISISILKKEIDLFGGVVPFIKYQNHLFHLRPIHIPKLPDHFHIQRITHQSSLDILADFLHHKQEEVNSDLQAMVIPSMASLASLLQRELLYIYCLRQKDQIYGMYFLKDVKCQYEDIDGNTLQCMASVMHQGSRDLFFLGFLHSLRNIIKQKSTYKMLFMDETSHTPILLKYWRTKHTPIFSNETAYYLYNFIYPSSPLSPGTCLFLI
jgi:hypothetical protein